MKIKFVRNRLDAANFTLTVGGAWVSICLHVDDMGVFSNLERLTNEVFNKLSEKVTLKRSKELSLLVAINSKRTGMGIELHQQTLIEKMCRTAALAEGAAAATPTVTRFRGFTDDQLVTEPKDRLVLNTYPYRAGRW